MTEPNEAMKAMARRVAQENAPAMLECLFGGTSSDTVKRVVHDGLKAAALAAIIETQRADAECISQKRERLLDLCAASGVTDIRAACDMALEAAEQTIRTGNHYGKDESHD